MVGLVFSFLTQTPCERPSGSQRLGPARSGEKGDIEEVAACPDPERPVLLLAPPLPGSSFASENSHLMGFVSLATEKESTLQVLE